MVLLIVGIIVGTLITYNVMLYFVLKDLNIDGFFRSVAFIMVNLYPVFTIWQNIKTYRYKNKIIHKDSEELSKLSQDEYDEFLDRYSSLYKVTKHIIKNAFIMFSPFNSLVIVPQATLEVKNELSSGELVIEFQEVQKRESVIKMIFDNREVLSTFTDIISSKHLSKKYS